MLVLLRLPVPEYVSMRQRAGAGNDFAGVVEGAQVPDLAGSPDVSVPWKLMATGSL
ncbi:MAG: hypothetical protein IPJ48_10295 [Propionivibrio sp.]|uniref:Uncharacterized protein n=1 Tax=Candidatus Propionivibrio dominans TaxID=2954373 RepID=A0A9D7FKC3_9RHOO|nr:hypothetical protein [Candidatus Propionivibrio dominans]